MAIISKEEEKIQLGIVKAMLYMNLYNSETDGYKKFCYLRDALLISTEFTPPDFIEKHLALRKANKEVSTKVKLLKIIRHLLSHYPFFSSGEEIFFDYDMMKGGQIISYFEGIKNNPLHIQFQYISGEIVNCKITTTPLGPGGRIYFNDMFRFTGNSFLEDKNAPLVLMTMMAITLFQEYIRSIVGLSEKIGIQRENSSN